MKPRAAVFLIPTLILVFPLVMAQYNMLRKTTHLAQRANTPGTARKTGEIIIEPAALTTPNGETIPFELGTLFVPENRSDPKARIIGRRVRAPSPAASYSCSSNLSADRRSRGFFFVRTKARQQQKPR